MASEFLNRWSRRKLNPEAEIEELVEQSDEMLIEEPELAVEPSEPESAEPIPEGIEETEQEGKELSVAELLATGAAASVKKAALRKLFLSGEFSAVDNLNDYDHDYASVGKLSVDVAQKLRDWVKDVEEEPVEEEALVEHEPREEVEAIDEQDSTELAAEQDIEDLNEPEDETKYPT